MKENDLALKAYEQCIDFNEGVVDNQIYTGWAYDNASLILSERGDYETILDFTQKAADIYRREKGPNYKYLAYVLDLNAFALEQMQQYDSAASV